MAVRLLIMFSIMIAELAMGIAGILGIADQHPRTVPAAAVAGVVAIVACILIAWLVTIALFVRASSRARARKIVDDARRQAAAILADAADKALALCSLDGGRCPRCNNPRTGKFCPKCGLSAQPSPDEAQHVLLDS